jgi:hypothetical protein
MSSSQTQQTGSAEKRHQPSSMSVFSRPKQYVQEIQDQQSFKRMLGRTFNIIHSELDITQDITCSINYSGSAAYKAAALQIQEYLKGHFPGMQVEVNKLSDNTHIVDIRLRKGVGTGDDFIHYIENLSDKELESSIQAEIQNIIGKLNLELINMGFDFDFKSSEEDALQHSDLKKLMSQKFNIKHPKLDIGQDVTCSILFSEPMVYKYCAYKIEEYLKHHFPGMKIVAEKLGGSKNSIDIRMRKGVTGGDEFIYYLENISETEVETTLKKAIPQIMKSITIQLAGMGFEFHYNSSVLQVQDQQQLKFKQGQTFNITHPKLDISHDVGCTILHSGSGSYNSFAHKLKESLRHYYPGMQITTAKITEVNNAIDIRLRKGVSGGDDFIYYLQDINEQHIDNVIESEFPKILNKINFELLSMGFIFDFKTSEQNQQQKQQKLLQDQQNKPALVTQKSLQNQQKAILEKQRSQEEHKELKKVPSQKSYITHDKLTIEEDITCYVNWAEPLEYKTCAVRIEEVLKAQFPGLHVIVNLFSEDKELLDIRIAGAGKGIEFTPEILYAIENVPATEIQQKIQEQLPQIISKVQLKLSNMGFKLHSGTEESYSKEEHISNITPEKTIQLPEGH